MKTVYLIICLCTASCVLVSTISFGQKTEDRLTNAFKNFESDSQFKHALISLYVVDSKTGKVVFDKNAQVGLAPASCLKVVTGAAALELLGKDYRFKTEIGYDGNIEDSVLKGNLLLKASGDPTTGSWRWGSTGEEKVHQQLLSALQIKHVKIIQGDFIINDADWETQAIPGGWTWEDIGNYYGAGARGMNWHENQYDLMLKPGKQTGDPVEISGSAPELEGTLLINELRTGKPGSGDNSIIYLPENGTMGFVRGTVAGGNKTFTVSGAMPDATGLFGRSVEKMLMKNGIDLKGRSKSAVYYFLNKEKIPVASKTIMTLFSPPLDSINYWFLQKSVNLYGEAFVKTIAYEKTGFGSTDTGLSIIRDFWSKKGIEKPALHMIDGSGLSPANRVTAHALVTIMQYAKKQSWYPSFYEALPEQNGIKMKSGYIGGVRSYTGYIRSRSGNEYTFSFIINNYDGSSGAVREKMWKLLDVLK
jgi:D-alanyl-D-alanine carboxypeptidase/D-alanyl-D-alanine-endopeptidase (penicillin-binding protein 4)